MTFSQIHKFLTLNETDCCSEKVFYLYQDQITQKIIQLARDTVQKYADDIEKDAIVSLDSAWDHRRHGSTCIVTIIDIKTRKIIEFAINSVPKQFVEGTTDQPSRNLEKVGVGEIAERWKNSEKVLSYVHDNDAVSRKLIEESGWKITEALDPGHAIKAIKKNLENFNKNNGKPFKGLVESIGRYLEKLFRDKEITKEKRIELYNNIPNHYIGKHKKCAHKEGIKTRSYKGKNKEYFVDNLKEFLKKNKHYAEKVNPNINTQNNECFNNFKTKYLRKDTKYSTSTTVRLCLSIIEWNDPQHFEEIIFNALNMQPLCSPFCDILKGRKDAQMKKNAARRNPEVAKKLNEKRRKKLKAKGDANKKADGYKPGQKLY